MKSLKEKKLHRIEITKSCHVIGPIQALIEIYGIPSANRSKKGHATDTLPHGVRGWLVKKYGRTYFKPDENQEDLDWVSNGKHAILISLRKIEGCYMAIESSKC